MAVAAGDTKIRGVRVDVWWVCVRARVEKIVSIPGGTHFTSACHGYSSTGTKDRRKVDTFPS